MKGCCGKSGVLITSRRPAQAVKAATPARITIQAARPDLASEYMQFVYKGDRVEILYMRAEGRNGNLVLTYRHSECIFFSQYPEARQLFNGVAWNLEELSAWARLVSEDREFLEAVKA